MTLKEAEIPHRGQGSVRTDGYAIVPGVLGLDAIGAALDILRTIDRSRPEVMAGNALFAIRNVLSLAPGLLRTIWTDRLSSLVREHLGDNAFITKSIYFDKPSGSNWAVASHQDISISIDRAADVPGFSGWTNKRGIIGAIPPLHILESALTIRLHLDATDGTNGALHVIPGSHRAGIVPAPPVTRTEVICAVPQGGAMLMRPLLFHASRRSLSNAPRRVLHLEFNHLDLPEGLQWAERRSLPT
ncbi:MAG: phytanoyl-CoA dioxygenase family protein [Bacteroidetes bacterium]|nr:phytanoyl-CoA dioxygenase family protein [Bacteroidota bacterium]